MQLSDATEHASAGSLHSPIATTTAKANSASDVRSNARWFWIVLLAVTAVGSAYAYAHLKSGWIAGDDGFLAQCALRVLRGELPHRDFRDNYTGGLAIYHALAFRVFGVNLVALRYAVFIVMVPWIAAVYYVASRFASAMAAGAIALLAVAWSLPTYSAAMPSWYNLFLATFGAAALLRFVEVGTRRWLFVAGLCGGLSCAIKIIGVYYVAAVLLFLIFREQSGALARAHEPGPRARAYPAFIAGGLFLFLGLIGWTLRHQLGSGELYHFVLPSAAVVLLLLWRESQMRAVGSRRRFDALLRLALPFILGFALPLAVLLAPYVKSNSLAAFRSGVFGGFENVMSAPRRPVAPDDGLLYVWPLFAAMAVALKRERSWGPAVNLLIATGLAAILFSVRSKYMIAFVAWRSAVMMGAVIVLLAIWFLARQRDFAEALSPQAEQGVFLLTALAGVCSLVQFPLPFPAYLCYIAPLLALALFAVISVASRCRSKLFFAQLLVFYLAFAVFFVDRRALYLNAFSYEPALQPLHLPRANQLRVHDASMVERATESILRVAQNGPILAAPESAELYFLTGLQNPTADDRRVTPQDFDRVVQDPRLKVVVVKHDFHFPASSLSPGELSEIGRQFPNVNSIGNYEIHWRP